MKNKNLGAMLGAIIFSLLYFTAYQSNAILFDQDTWNYVVISILSALNFYILMFITTRMNQHD